MRSATIDGHTLGHTAKTSCETGPLLLIRALPDMAARRVVRVLRGGRFKIVQRYGAAGAVTPAGSPVTQSDKEKRRHQRSQRRLELSRECGAYERRQSVTRRGQRRVFEPQAASSPGAHRGRTLRPSAHHLPGTRLRSSSNQFWTMTICGEARLAGRLTIRKR
jgi:hypothetical protein